jgi:dCMP deaminase
MNSKWHSIYMQTACLLASGSSDPKKQVGCVLTNEKNRIVSTGVNGPPSDIDDVFTEEERLAGTIHAEINALLDREGRAVYNCYVWPVAPCAQCMAALAQAGIKRVFSRHPPSEKWRWDIAQKIAKQKNIEVIFSE